MARVLAYTSPARGHLYPLTPIMDELRRRGHYISLRTLRGEVPLMRSRGFAAAPISAQVEAIELQDWRSRNPRRALKLAVRGFAQRAEFDAADLRAAIEQDQPDIVLVDVNSWGAQAVAEQWGGPWASVCPYPMALRSRDVPPFGPGLAPARGPLGRSRDRLIGGAITHLVAGAMLPTLNSVRAAVGVPALKAVDEVFGKAPLTLYLTAEPFEYHRGDWPAGIVMVGPCAWEPPADPPDWLAAIDRPIVLVTTSSEFQDDGRLVRTALEALATEPVHLVATMPAGVDRDFVVPGNAHVESYVAHSAVLQRAACAITHGGMGATQKALALGVPVCAVPFGRDQLEVARRVEVADAGTRLPAKRLRADRLLAAVRSATEKRSGAQRVADGFAAAGGPVAAADAIEERLLHTEGSPICTKYTQTARITYDAVAYGSALEGKTRGTTSPRRGPA